MVKSRHLALTCVDSDFCITAIFFFGFALKLSPMPPQKNKCRPIGFCGFQTPQWCYSGELPHDSSESTSDGLAQTNEAGGVGF